LNGFTRIYGITEKNCLIVFFVAGAAGSVDQKLPPAPLQLRTIKQFRFSVYPCESVQSV
jgi:hypothetical protein